MNRIIAEFRRMLGRLGASGDGSTAPLFALAIVPVLAATGAAVDYSRANATRTGLQNALDASLIAAAREGGATWPDTALSLFLANADARGGVLGTPIFTIDAEGRYSGEVTARLPTNFVGFLGISYVDVRITAKAVGPGAVPDSCILTFGSGQAISTNSINFNGAPNVALEGCGIRSNTSINCSGHSGGSTASIAAGSVSGCTNPVTNARRVPDLLAGLASTIERRCGNPRPGATWTPGALPTGSGVTTVLRASHLEYHICGDLTVSGSGSLAGLGATDTVIVIENGSLVVARDAEVTIPRTAIVFSGSGSAASRIQFPNGAGQAARLFLTPPLDPANPWQGIAVYRDPALTSGIDEDWGPGATFRADGVVYLPKSSLLLRGIATSHLSRCTKFITNSFGTNGSVVLDFAQVQSGCVPLRLWRFADVQVHLTH
jgi:hypothetical protein